LIEGNFIKGVEMEKLPDNEMSKIINKILDLTYIHENKLEIRKDKSLFEFETYLSLLNYELLKDENISKKITDLKYCTMISSDINNFELILDVLTELKTKNLNNYNEFKNILDLKIKSLKSEFKQYTLYEMYIPLNLKTEFTIEKIKCRNFCAEIVKYRKIKGIINQPKLNESIKKAHEIDPQCEINVNFDESEFLKITVNSQTDAHACLTARKIQNLFIGMVAYVITKNSSYRTLKGPTEAIFPIYPQIMIETIGTQFVTVFVGDITRKRIPKDCIIPIEKFYETELNYLIQFYNSKRPDIQKKLEEIFTNYACGVYQDKKTDSFFNLWVALERATMVSDIGKHDMIPKISKALFNERNPLYAHVIENLYTVRNNFIHEGGSISQYDRNALKYCVDNLIEFLIKELNSYSLNEIKTIYEYLTKNGNNLENIQKTIEHVIELKKNWKGEISEK